MTKPQQMGIEDLLDSDSESDSTIDDQPTKRIRGRTDQYNVTKAVLNYSLGKNNTKPKDLP